MTSVPVERVASCSCGQLVARVRGDPARVSVCHCLACQRRSGSVFAEQARFDRTQVTIDGQATEYRRTGDEGSTAVFAFCPVCGTTVHYRPEARDDIVVIPVGAFADPGFPAPSVSVYNDRKHAWVTMPEGIEMID